jgi:hypothetical protein
MNLGYHVARWQACTVRQFYRTLLPLIVRRHVDSPQTVALRVFAYSGEAMLPEQIASIRSFLRYVGRPQSFTIVSDGSHSDHSIRLLELVDPVVSVRKVHQPAPDLPEKLQNYLSSHPTGKQLGLIMSLPDGEPALYVDADVRFFPAATDLIKRAAERDTSAYYLADCQFSGDTRLLHGLAEQREPVNTGVLLLFEKLDWSLSIARFLELDGEPDFFTNQTMTHLAMHKNDARPFDPTKYVLQLDDQFLFADRYAGAALALRHYVNPVRHKFWTSLKH